MSANQHKGRAVEDVSSVSGHRLVMVLEQIALRGPVSLSALEATLDIPRVSIWRAARSLRERGWVRMQFGTRALELTPFVNRLFSHAHVAVPECDEYGPVLERLLQTKLYHVSVGLLHGVGNYDVIETTMRGGGGQRPQSLVFDIGPLAAQLACDRVEVHRHLVNFVRRATVEEQRIIRSGEHIRQLETLSGQEVIWDQDGTGFAVPWRFATGSSGALEVYLRSQTRKARSKIIDLARDVRALGIPSYETQDLLRPKNDNNTLMERRAELPGK